MSFSWERCFLCDGSRRLSIGENFNKLLGYKNIQCPLCEGKGELAIKSSKINPWEKNRKDFL